jgi:hypothetical protein
MMITSGAPPYMFEDAIRAACVILNECRLAPGSDKTPYELFYGKKPTFHNKVQFYQIGMSHISHDERKGKGKLTPKAEKVRFIGYPQNYHDSYVIFNPKTKDTKVRHDIKWIESSLLTNQIIEEAAMQMQERKFPQSVKEALNSPERLLWIAAIKKEMRALFELGTFRILKQIRGQRNDTKLKSKFIFEVKKDGTYKCRLVACGYSQVKGKDYDETYSPTVAYKGICSLLHEAAHHNWEICTGDIGNAFLNSKLDKDVKVKLPDGFWDLLGMEPRQVQILGALYGLKQSGRMWYQTLVNILIDYGFKQSIYDPCIFYLNNTKEIMKLACHVDDILIISSNPKASQVFLKYLETRVHKVKVLTEDITYLGLEINRDRQERKVYLTQKAYMKKLLDELIGPHTTGISKYPLSTIHFKQDTTGTNPPIHDIIGKLRFLVDRTRPDLLYPVGLLSRYMVNPSAEVMLELTRLLKYIKYTQDYHIVLGGRYPLILFGMSDASYVQDGDCKSQLGYVIFLSLDSGPVYCRSKRSTTVSLSSTQSEVDALVELAKEILWFQGFLESIGIIVEYPTKLFVDNMPTVTLTGEGNHLKRSKHYVVKTTFLKDQVEYGIVDIQHIPGVENSADILTKALSGHLLEYHSYGILGLPKM